jgi:hypothetical protein
MPIFRTGHAMPLEKSQLISAKRLLKHALDLVTDVKGIFDRADDNEAGRRLDGIRQRLVSEIEEIERLQAAQSL